MLTSSNIFLFGTYVSIWNNFTQAAIRPGACKHQQLCRVATNFFSLQRRQWIFLAPTLLFFWVKLDWKVFWTLGWHHIICLSVAFVGGILSLCDTPEQLHGFKKVSRASVNIVTRSKWVKFHFGVNHPFKLLLLHLPPKAVSGDTVGWRRVGHFVTNETSVSNI